MNFQLNFQIAYQRKCISNHRLKWQPFCSGLTGPLIPKTGVKGTFMNAFWEKLFVINKAVPKGVNKAIFKVPSSVTSPLPVYSSVVWYLIKNYCLTNNALSPETPSEVLFTLEFNFCYCTFIYRLEFRRHFCLAMNESNENKSMLCIRETKSTLVYDGSTILTKYDNGAVCIILSLKTQIQSSHSTQNILPTTAWMLSTKWHISCLSAPWVSFRPESCKQV